MYTYWLLFSHLCLSTIHLNRTFRIRIHGNTIAIDRHLPWLSPSLAAAVEGNATASVDTRLLKRRNMLLPLCYVQLIMSIWVWIHLLNANIIGFLCFSISNTWALLSDDLGFRSDDGIFDASFRLFNEQNFNIFPLFTRMLYVRILDLLNRNWIRWSIKCLKSWGRIHHQWLRDKRLQLEKSQLVINHIRCLEQNKTSDRWRFKFFTQRIFVCNNSTHTHTQVQIDY